MAIDPLLLKSLLTARGLTLRQLAFELNTPVSTLSSWLHAVSPSPNDLASRIATVLGVTPESLCTPK